MLLLLGSAGACSGEPTTTGVRAMRCVPGPARLGSAADTKGSRAVTSPKPAPPADYLYRYPGRGLSLCARLARAACIVLELPPILFYSCDPNASCLCELR